MKEEALARERVLHTVEKCLCCDPGPDRPLCTMRTPSCRYLARDKSLVPRVIKSFSRSRGSKGKERREEEEEGPQRMTVEGERGKREKGTTDFGSAAPALCESPRG